VDVLSKEKLGYYDKGVLQKRGVFLHTPSKFSKLNLLYVLWAASFKCAEHYEINRKNISSYLNIYSVICIEKGEMEFVYEGHNFTARKGDTIFLYSGFPNNYWAKSNVEFTFIHFGGALAEKYYNLLVNKSRPCFKYFLKTSSIITEILDELEKDNPNDHKMSAHIHSILSLLTEKDNKKSHSILKAISYIENNFLNNISLEDLASHVGLSKYHFGRLFKQEVFSTPHQYIINLRLKKAKHDLINTNNTIENIALHYGFSNSSHFIECFKKSIGTTPYEFRKLFLPLKS